MVTLDEEIAQAQVFISEPPKNESNTCEWIILPILWSTGYARRDIESRMADSTGQYPDYTLLPNHSLATFYLEAKAWNVTLEDIHVKQALNYANHNGKRFVVLTNGQNWRLYDNAVQGPLPDKLLTQVDLQNVPQITEFLTALSKSNVLQGSLEQMAEETRLRKLQEVHDLQAQERREEESKSQRRRASEMKVLFARILPDMLNDSEGELVILMTDCLKRKAEFEDLSPETLSMWFGENLVRPSPNGEARSSNPISAQLAPPAFPEYQDGSTRSLKEIQGRPIDGKKGRPLAVQAPDGTNILVSSWVNLAEQIVRCLLQESRPMPLPFECSHPKRWFLNMAPEHKRQDQRKKFKQISAHGKTVYMDADRSAVDLMTDVHALCLAMKVAPDDFRITTL